jgi:phosphatidylcholine synthase
VLACVILTFVPLKWAHPLRTPLLWPVTVGAIALWGLAAAHVLWAGFPAGPLAQGVMLLAAGYFIGLTVYAGRVR